MRRRRDELDEPRRQRLDEIDRAITRRRDRIASGRPGDVSHHAQQRRLVLVLPHDCNEHPPEYTRRWWTEHQVDQVYTGELGTRWRDRARGAGHDDPTQPVLLWEHVGWDVELAALSTVTLQPTDHPLVPPRQIRGRDPKRPHHLELEWRAVARPLILQVGSPGLAAELHLLGGTIEAAQVQVEVPGGRARVTWRADADLEPEFPDPREQELLPPTPVGDRTVLVLSDLPVGTATLRVSAAGQGAVESVTLLVGGYQRVERHRSYHRVPLD